MTFVYKVFVLIRYQRIEVPYHNFSIKNKTIFESNKNVKIKNIQIFSIFRVNKYNFRDTEEILKILSQTGCFFFFIKTRSTFVYIYLTMELMILMSNFYLNNKGTNITHKVGPNKKYLWLGFENEN